MQNLLKRKKKIKKMKNYFLLVILLKNSGYSNHLSANLEAFTSLDQSASIQVKMSDGKIQESNGKCTVEVKSCGMGYIKNVLYVPELRSISIGRVFCGS